MGSGRDPAEDWPGRRWTRVTAAPVVFPTRRAAGKTIRRRCHFLNRR